MIRKDRYNFQRSQRRPGVTLMETLAVVVIVAILITLVVTGVQQARETARGASCKHQVHQLGIACYLYESTFRCFPGYDQRGMAHLTPMIGGTLSGKPRSASILDECHTSDCSDISRPAIAVCPSDELAGRTVRAISYRFSKGLRDDPLITQVYGMSPGPFETNAGGYQIVRHKDVVDGLSNTSLISERLIPLFATFQNISEIAEFENQRSASGDIQRAVWTTYNVFGDAGFADEFVAECRENYVDHLAQLDNCFFDQYTLSYDHTAPPNSRTCLNGEPSSARGGPGLYPAASRHSGGVNVLMCDGSVRFIANQTDLKLWRAMGTRNGSD